MAAFATEGAVDFDVREALDSLIRTYRTLESGFVYESLPANPLAANIHRSVQAAVAEFRQREQQKYGMSRTRDADVLGVLVFLQRLEMERNNGRQRGRAFLDGLRGFYSAPEEAAGFVDYSSLTGLADAFDQAGAFLSGAYYLCAIALGCRSQSYRAVFPPGNRT